MKIEKHLAHWTKNFNGRIDIALTYKEKLVGAKYIILVNGVNIQFYHLNDENFYSRLK